MDPVEANPDRFRRISPISAAGAALRIRSRSANRAQTGGFRSIIREVRKLKDWMVERGGFELPYPSFDRVQTGGREQGPNFFESGPCSRDLELLPVLSLSRSCGRPIALAETFAASAITPLDKTWSKVFAAAIATDQLARLRLATHLLS